MARRIQTTKRFNLISGRIYYYVYENWGINAADNFMQKLANRFAQLRKYPEFGRPSKKKPNVRRLPVGRQNILYYSNKKSKTYIHNMYSAYGDPGKNPYG